MFKKFTQNQEFMTNLKEDGKELSWVILITLVIGVPVTYLIYHPLI